MKIGYPCINNRINCTANGTFRLKNYSQENFLVKTKSNLECLKKILEFNYQNKILFFRIGSGLIPFASHERCQYDWEKEFRKELREIGQYIISNNFRVSMHPDQFVVLNALKKEIVKKSIEEIDYHCSVLDAMNLGKDAKVQIHIGGVYNEKEKSKERFIKNYSKLSLKIKKRLVIENDHVSYSLKDCLEVSKKTGLPILLDVYHHQCLNNGESLREAIKKAGETWKKEDGCLMIDYSSQKKKARKGVHAEKIDTALFKKFLEKTKGLDFDLMLEIKDKEESVLKILKYV
jgi:UV DNA damage endonuclease